MTVAALAASREYTENGSTTAFAIPFRFLASGHLYVTRTFVDGSMIELALGVDYTTTGGATDEGGTLTVTAPAAAGTVLRIARQTPRQQGTQYTTGDRFPAVMTEQTFDQAMLISQEQDTSIDQVARNAAAAIAPVNVKLVDFGDKLAAVAASAGGPQDPDILNNLVLDQPETLQWYAENGARIQRARDRMFVGGATKNNGTNAGSQPDWLTQGLLALGRTFAFQQVTQFATLTDSTVPSSNAILGAARTALLPENGYGAIGILGVGWNDNTAKACGAWGGYFEAFRKAGVAGPSVGVEIDTANFGSVTTTTPYAQDPGQTIGLQLANGAEFLTAKTATLAINIQNNGAKYNAGINFGATALVGTDGTGSGTAVAIQFARGHGMKWFNAAGGQTTQIFGTSSDTNSSATVVFDDNTTSILNSGTGKGLFQIGNIGATGVNYLGVRNAATGNAVPLQAIGDDADISITIAPKNNGILIIPPANVRAFANDAAAAAAGIPIGGFYRNGSAVQMRIA